MSVDVLMGRQRALFVGDLAFLNTALLIEKGMHKHVGGIVLVTAPVDVRVRRARDPR